MPTSTRTPVSIAAVADPTAAAADGEEPAAAAVAAVAVAAEATPGVPDAAVVAANEDVVAAAEAEATGEEAEAMDAMMMAELHEDVTNDLGTDEAAAAVYDAATAAGSESGVANEGGEEAPGSGGGQGQEAIAVAVVGPGGEGDGDAMEVEVKAEIVPEAAPPGGEIEAEAVPHPAENTEGGDVIVMATSTAAMAMDVDEEHTEILNLKPPPDLPPLPLPMLPPAPVKQDPAPATVTTTDPEDAPLALLKKVVTPSISTPKPSPKPGYYAVRVGYAASKPKEANEQNSGHSQVSVIRNAIFLQWEDVQNFVEFTNSKLSVEGGAKARGEVLTAVTMAAGLSTPGRKESKAPEGGGNSNNNKGVIQLPFHHNVEYKRFDEIERAERYLKKVIPHFNPATTTAGRGAKKLSKKDRLKAKKFAKAGKTRIKSLRRKAQLPDFPPPKNFNPPTKKWESMYAVAIQYKRTHGDLEVPTEPDADGINQFEELAKWIKYQRTSYRYYLEDPMGGRHSMTEEKVKRLKEVGFGWIVSDKKRWLAEDPPTMASPNGKRKRGRPRKTAASKLEELEAAAAIKEEEEAFIRPKNRPIRPKWLAMLQKIQEYKEVHGTMEVSNDETDEDLVVLRQWCKNQRNMHIRWRQGHDVGMTQEKADLLKEVGMEFPPSWEDMYVKIVQFKAQNNGSMEITQDYDPMLAAWMARQNEVLGRHLQGKSTRLSDDQAMRLLALGFQGGRGGTAAAGGGSVSVTGKSVASRDFDARWNDMLLRLRDYKTEHGDCNVPTSSGTDLAHWVAAQRRMYNKLVAGKPGKRAVLDAVKMQRLTELGFQFRPRGSYMAWDDQIKGLWKFREENGHCRIPVNHPELGSFVKLARRDFKNWMQGKSSSMTPEREAALKEVGFIFEGGKTPQRAQTPKKSWEERLEQLLQFKAEFGHTVVPQNSGQLGAWVHSQRVHYKKYKEGQKSQMTAEKALKLTEIGFCFNASDRYRGNKRHRTHEQEEEEAQQAAALEQQQHHHHQQQQHQMQQHHHHQQQQHHQMQETVHVPAFQPYL